MDHRSAFFVLLLPLGTAATAQTLTAANAIPPVGHSEVRTYHSTFSPPTLATSGTGNVWDGTGVEPFGLATLITYRAPGDSPYTANYPATTLCAERIPDAPPAEWRHFVVDDAHAEMIGVNTDAFIGGRTWCTFPFSIGSSYTDDWTVNSNNFSETNTFVATGTISAPWGTIEDVVMFESAGGFSYYFFSSSNLLDPIGTYIPGITMDIWRVETANGLAEPTAQTLHAWCDANGTVNVLLPAATGGTCSLVDTQGRTIVNARVSSKSVLLPMATQAAGVYTVVYQNEAGQRWTTRVVR